MNLQESKYEKSALVREMMDTVDVIKNFNPSVSEPFVESIKGKKALFATGEGSSRIFPAKRSMYAALKRNSFPVFSEGATQALEYQLSDYAVFGASNSGKTKEVIRLFKKLKEEGHDSYFGLTAFHDTPLAEISKAAHVLSCGTEDAVAATKSVIEQGLFYDSLLRNLEGLPMEGLDKLAGDIETALTMTLDPDLVISIKNADTIMFAGRNTGVAEELRLKTNEITRKKSDFLEGTYAVHGIEEVLTVNDVVIVIEPFESEEEKFSECLVDGVGLKVIAISSRETRFPTIRIPYAGEYANYVELAAGWNILVDTGLALGIDPDKTVRARKVGNEYIA
jgi:glucosamine--fructose-6-phosphate aminotransferase (isomerizing)